MTTLASSVAAQGQPVKFYDVAPAIDWRAEFGGWIFAADNGVAIWFPLAFTASKVMTHDATTGLNGRLV